jgi:hypothetical protein
MWRRVVHYIITDILEEPATSVFKVEKETVRKETVRIQRDLGRGSANWADK